MSWKSATRQFIRFAAAAVAGLYLMTPAAQAALCAPRAALIAELGKRYQEEARGIGLASPVSVVELFVSAKGTWTIIITDARKQSCILGAGTSWESTSPQLLLPPGA